MADQEAPPSLLRQGRTLLQVRAGAAAAAHAARAVAGVMRGEASRVLTGACHTCQTGPHTCHTTQDLLCAAMHARAAYGFPLAAGLMSDVPSYIRLQTLQPLT